MTLFMGYFLIIGKNLARMTRKCLVFCGKAALSRWVSILFGKKIDRDVFGSRFFGLRLLSAHDILSLR